MYLNFKRKKISEILTELLFWGDHAGCNYKVQVSLVNMLRRSYYLPLRLNLTRCWMYSGWWAGSRPAGRARYRVGLLGKWLVFAIFSRRWPRPTRPAWLSRQTSSPRPSHLPTRSWVLALDLAHCSLHLQAVLTLHQQLVIVFTGEYVP